MNTLYSAWSMKLYVYNLCGSKYDAVDNHNEIVGQRLCEEARTREGLHGNKLARMDEGCLED